MKQGIAVIKGLNKPSKEPDLKKQNSFNPSTREFKVNLVYIGSLG